MCDSLKYNDFCRRTNHFEEKTRANFSLDFFDIINIAISVKITEPVTDNMSDYLFPKHFVRDGFKVLRFSSK